MSEQDYDRAGEEINALIDELQDEGLNAGAVLGGMLTALVFRLIVSAPDSSSAIGMITSCMANGARIAAEYDFDEDEVMH